MVKIYLFNKKKIIFIIMIAKLYQPHMGQTFAIYIYILFIKSLIARFKIDLIFLILINKQLSVK